MDFLPIFYNLQQQRCLLVGGGDVALRKASLLVSAGAKLCVVAPQLCPDLDALIQEHDGEYYPTDYTAAHLEGVVLVISAIEDQAVDEQVSADAKQQGLPVNVVDKPSLSNFIIPAVIDRSPIVMAVSSGGQSPVLARLLRGKLESMIPASYGRLGQLAGRFREQVKARFETLNQRRVFWESVLQGPVAEMIFAGKDRKAEQLLEQALEEGSTGHSDGEVYLVGGGPGDPDLLTFKALRLMQQADVVVYDRLVSRRVLDLCRRDADRVFVGKACNQHVISQEEINALLVRLAKEGKRVLRLKGGDPFIFGRGGEEIGELMAEDIPFQVVPGITSASGCAAYAGIPLTHQNYAQSVRFVTGHMKDGQCDLPWPELVQEHQTLVIYMGLLSLTQICEQLMRHGMSPRMPIALVENGTLPEQRILTGTLADIADQAAVTDFQPPALIIIGKVVALRDRLDWYSQS
ncbi:siroheme synthase CysG [Aliamphritea spongicola]|uniref:siroheme synthase CysG n=1 Tax=Aliamphritea spongicola TaxID=707589 RepID=UPI00196B71C0|nr:siroheme synthase CysG [Aliamphritea spongicola]MBN3564184.1 uroporphyrinogen-III C-methyltransferase [Aliamphritea spongicola]